MGITPQALQPIEPVIPVRPTIDDADATILSVLGNREARRRYFKRNRKKAFLGMNWQDVNDDKRIEKQKPFINEAKRQNKRG